MSNWWIMPFSHKLWRVPRLLVHTQRSSPLSALCRTDWGQRGSFVLTRTIAHHLFCQAWHPLCLNYCLIARFAVYKVSYCVLVSFLIFCLTALPTEHNRRALWEMSGWLYRRCHQGSTPRLSAVRLPPASCCQVSLKERWSLYHLSASFFFLFFLPIQSPKVFPQSKLSISCCNETGEV